MAFLAAGLLSPFATCLLVLLNIFGAYPMYAKVAERSPHGRGSIAILEDLLPSWWGKLLVLSLLGFATTDFIMTITLCSSDAAKHVVENPWAPSWLQNQMEPDSFPNCNIRMCFSQRIQRRHLAVRHTRLELSIADRLCNWCRHIGNFAPSTASVELAGRHLSGTWKLVADSLGFDNRISEN